MPLDYHASRSGWLLYGRGLDDKQRLALNISRPNWAPQWWLSPLWCVEDYQVIRLAGSLTPRCGRWLARQAQWMSRRWSGRNFRICRTPGLLVMDMDSTAIQIECIDEIAKLAGTGEGVAVAK